MCDRRVRQRFGDARLDLAREEGKFLHACIEP